MRRLDCDSSVTLRLNVNGVERRGQAEARTSLLDFLRYKLGLTGTHAGCEHGVCGACTVLIDGLAQRSCLVLAVQAEGCRVETVESLAGAGGELSALQAAFRAHHALQCGFCTPGILLSASALLRRVANPTEAEVRAVLGGHLCRCTGYTPILRAILAAADPTSSNNESA